MGTRTTAVLVAVLAAGIFFSILTVSGAEPPNLAAMVAKQQPPKVELPKLPADGSGVYRLSLNQALGAAPLVVLLEVKGAQVVRAVALPIHQTRVPWQADALKLAVKDGKVTGPLVVQSMKECNLHPDRFTRADLAKAASCELKPDETQTFTLEGDTYSTSAPYVRLGRVQDPVKKGTVTVLREAPRPMPEVCDVELQMYAGMADITPVATAYLRAKLVKGTATELRSYVMEGFNPKLVESAKGELKLQDGRLTGRVEGTVGRPFTLEIAGEAIGRQLYGTVTCVDGASRVTTAWLGQLHDVSAWRLPIDYSRTDWTWEHDLPADPSLTNQAAQEALSPVLPGEPGKTKFWTWRQLAVDREFNAASCIYAPSFDLQEVAGAVKYQFVFTGAKPATGEELTQGHKVECTLDKPWHPITPAWKDLRTGYYRFVVTPLAADGSPIPGKMRMNIMDRGVKYSTNAVGWVTKEMESIGVMKRPSFQGPYFTPRVAWTDLALDCSRWERDGAPIPEAPFSPAGRNNAFIWAWSGASQVWGNLTARSFTTDPAERVLAEAALAYLAGETVTHQAIHGGMINDYKSYTAVSHFMANAAIDTVVQTGDPQWREIVLTYARALVKLQNNNGSFGSLKGKGTAPGGGWADWAGGNPEFGASELLYTLGRIRRDLKTDEFVEAEKKALGWMMNRAIPERFFPTYVHHSASQGYPVGQHPISALMFARYLLELAPAGERNVKLAEELARWAEDYGIDWTRRPAGPQKGRITPFIPAADRINCDPLPSNLLAAIVFEQLGRVTGDKLWTAKADALAAAVTVARDPATGYIRSDLSSTWRADYGYTYNYGNGMAGRGWAMQLLREYDVLKTAK